MKKVMQQVSQGKMPDLGALMRQAAQRALSALRAEWPYDSDSPASAARKNPIWRVVAADQRSTRDGRVIETLGHYNAADRALDDRRSTRSARSTGSPRGAQPSDTVRKLLKIQGIS